MGLLERTWPREEHLTKLCKGRRRRGGGRETLGKRGTSSGYEREYCAFFESKEKGKKKGVKSRGEDGRYVGK